MQHPYILIYLLIMNAITFLTYGADKQKAKKNKWRISEKTLLILALAGGSIGALLGMQVFHHKTKKPLFKYGVPLILLLQVVIITKTVLGRV